MIRSRYKLRSSSKPPKNDGMAAEAKSSNNHCDHKAIPSTSKDDTGSQPPEKKARMSICRRKVFIKQSLCPKTGDPLKDPHLNSVSSTTILSLDLDVVLHLAKY